MIDVYKETFVHCGTDNLDLRRIKKVKNEVKFGLNKPSYGTGLWASPCSSNFGWEQFCISESFNIESTFLKSFFRIKSSSRVYEINSLTDLYKLPKVKSEFGVLTIDFNKITDYYDVVFLTRKGEIETRLNNDFSLYGWDCECILVLNRGVIEKVKL